MTLGPFREIRGGGGGLIRPRVTITREDDRVVLRRPGVSRWTATWAGLMGLIMLAGAVNGQVFMMVLTALWALFSWRLIRLARLSVRPDRVVVRRMLRDEAVPTSGELRFSVVDKRGFYGTKYRVLAVEQSSGELATASAFSTGSGTGDDGWLHQTAACLNDALPGSLATASPPGLS
jgi:hypothetical protein